MATIFTNNPTNVFTNFANIMAIILRLIIIAKNQLFPFLLLLLLTLRVSNQWLLSPHSLSLLDLLSPFPQLNFKMSSLIPFVWLVMHLISPLSILSSMSLTSWLIDFACCNYTTPHSSLFSQLDLAPHPLNIRTTNGSTMFGHNIGSISTSNLSVPGVFNIPNLLLQFIFCETISLIGLSHYL